LFLVLLSVGCLSGREVIEHRECFSFDTNLTKIGNEIMDDMEIMMPEYRWEYLVEVDKNCIVVRGVEE